MSTDYYPSDGYPEDELGEWEREFEQTEWMQQIRAQQLANTVQTFRSVLRTALTEERVYKFATLFLNCDIPLELRSQIVKDRLDEMKGRQLKE